MTPTTTQRPFADSVADYALAGWPCILPVPAEAKSPPPVGFTGTDGRDTDPLQLVAWAATHADSSVALRMPNGVIGIDVDHYDKGSVSKRGADTIAECAERWGSLPATWASTARGTAQDTGPSRILLYRVPAGRYATKLGGAVEIIQRHHRYAVVAPSWHHEVGAAYRWYAPDGLPADSVPKPVELSELPAAWVAGLAEGATEAGPAAADSSAGYRMLAAVQADQRPPCAEVHSATLTATDLLDRADEGSRHDTMTGRVHQLVQLAAAGHPGVGWALLSLEQRWADLTAGEDRAAEWERMLLTSARKAVTAVGRTEPVDRDPCTLIGQIPIAAPAPADDRPDSEETTFDPVEPPRRLHPLEIIGTHLFDPRGQLDQTMAQAVLERVHPVLRFAYDSRTWLLRGPDAWGPRADLAEWAVALLADLMPAGNPEAEKGSDERARAERRKRFMSAGPATAVAKKARALVIGGTHPCSLEIAELDREPWLLWAGGIGWDLRASRERLTPARIDPATPHLHSAAVTPEMRPTPLWDAFTAAVWPDPELRAWALRVLSIAVTGYSDKALPILIGERDRGKTQVVVLLMSVLGSYAHAADPRLLGGADKAHASIIYALMGRRLSFIDEGPREGRLGQERLKQLTGGAELTGNQMHTNPVTFPPTHTLVLTANDEPILTDPAVRSRVRLIPCEGDPERVIATRAAIGHPSGTAWRAEAPGVLAAMINEASAWLAEPGSTRDEAAPTTYRGRAEEIAAEQDPTVSWLAEETEPSEEGTRSRALYEAFVGWARNGNLHPGRIPTETKWGRALTDLGYPVEHTRTGKVRPLRLRQRGGWLPEPPIHDAPGSVDSRSSVTGWPSRDGLVTGSESNPSQVKPQANSRVSQDVTGVTGLEAPIAHARTHTHAHDAQAHVRTHESQSGANPSHPSHPSRHDGLPANSTDGLNVEPVTNPSPTRHQSSTGAASTQADRRVSAKAPKADPAERAALKAAAKAAKIAAAVTEAAGELVVLPAVVDRDGGVVPVSLARAAEIVRQQAAAWGELTLDVETTGYPVGHEAFALRTVQLGGVAEAVVFDAGDPAHRAVVHAELADASALVAHSATADLVPLARAGLLDAESAWRRMRDTVIPAKLADPASTGSDPGLKQLAGSVLGQQATAPTADEARAALFRAGRWLTDTKATTPVERSGWARVDRACTTMVRYAASDVLDTAALSQVLPKLDPVLLERERAVQRITARVAHHGLRIDGEHVARLLVEHTAARAAAAERVRAHGIDNPGSDPQVGAALAQLGAALPLTPTGRPSVAAGVLEPLRGSEGRVGELVAAVLDYRHHDTAVGTFLEPYQQLVQRGDGRARPTIYTLAADTGRMSCVRPNLQQVPREGGFRACTTADPGQLLISADFSGVEIRVMAALSQDRNLLRMLAEGADLHSIIAAQVFGAEWTKSDRYMVKRGVFGWAYGGSVPTLAKQVGCSEVVMASVVDVLAGVAPQYVEWAEQVKRSVRQGSTQFPTYTGRVIHLDRRYPHKAPNFLVQGSAREALVDALLKWQETRWGGSVVLPVHDEIVAVVPESEAVDATAALVTAMEAELFGVHILAEASAPSFAWADSS
jgi:DNA polymerase I-like protein with 3'-5' exonuclease and polymerase domains/phage/plasmid-associated DNA primase